MWSIGKFEKSAGSYNGERYFCAVGKISSGGASLRGDQAAAVNILAVLAKE